MFDSRQDRSSWEYCIDGIKIREAMEFNYLDSVERDDGICDSKLWNCEGISLSENIQNIKRLKQIPLEMKTAI